MERGADRTWPSLTREGTFRTPSAAVLFGDVMLTWYMRQGKKPLVGTRGQLHDHVALSVADLDAWIARLRAEGVNSCSTLSARRHPRRHDRRPQPGSDRAGGGQVDGRSVEAHSDLLAFAVARARQSAWRSAANRECRTRQDARTGLPNAAAPSTADRPLLGVPPGSVFSTARDARGRRMGRQRHRTSDFHPL